MSRKYHFDSREPVARAICDRCGFVVAHNTLREQRDFRGGDAPVGTGILVCPKCEDKPQPFFARPIVKNDPVPVENPRPPQS